MEKIIIRCAIIIATLIAITLIVIVTLKDKSEVYFDDKGIQKALTDKLFQSIDTSSQYKDIEVTLKSVFNEQYRTIFNIVVDESGNISKNPNVEGYLLDSSGNKFDISINGDGSTPYAGYYFLTFDVNIYKKEKVKLCIDKVNGVSGEWNFDLQVDGENIVNSVVNRTYNLEQYSVIIKNAIYTGSSMIIECESEKKIEYKDNYIYSGDEKAILRTEKCIYDEECNIYKYQFVYENIKLGKDYTIKIKNKKGKYEEMLLSVEW